MTRAPLKRVAVLAVAAAFCGLVAGCASPQGGGQSARLPDILNDVRQHPEQRLAGEVRCERYIADNQGDIPVKALFAGLLDVPEASGNQAFCAALIEAAIAGDFTRKDQDTFLKPKEIRGRKPVGALLRALIVAHERLYAQQAQQPPQAQSCGCGQ